MPVRHLAPLFPIAARKAMTTHISISVGDISPQDDIKTNIVLGLPKMPSQDFW